MSVIQTVPVADSATFLSAAKSVAELVQAVMTSLGIVVAGIWAYATFHRRRDPHPRIRLLQQLEHRPLSGEKTLLHVGLFIENVGQVLLRLNAGETKIQKIRPVEPNVLERDDYFKTEFDWPEVDRMSDWPECEIEPGEVESVHYDFLIPSDVQTVVVYSFVHHAAHSKDEDFGWAVQSLYDLHASAAGAQDRFGVVTTELPPNKPLLQTPQTLVEGAHVLRHVRQP